MTPDIYVSVYGGPEVCPYALLRADNLFMF